MEDVIISLNVITVMVIIIIILSRGQYHTGIDEASRYIIGRVHQKTSRQTTFFDQQMDVKRAHWDVGLKTVIASDIFRLVASPVPCVSVAVIGL